jgi:phytoene/squalene synthetase
MHASRAIRTRSISTTTIRPPVFRSSNACVALVKKHDLPNYLAGLLVAPHARFAYFAVHAFNIETALVRDKTARGQSAIGRVRLQWWREIVAAAFEDENGGGGGGSRAAHGVREAIAGGHPVAAALAETARGGVLTRRYFDRIVEAREADLEGLQPETLEQLERFGEDTVGSVLLLGLDAATDATFVGDVVVATDAAAAADAAALGLGRALALATTLRGVPHFAARGELYLPRDVLAACGVASASAPARVLAGTAPADETAALAASARDVADVARRHLEAAAALRPHLGAAARRALLPAVPARLYLDALARCDYDLFDKRLTPRSPLGLQLRLLWARALGRYV